MPELSRFYGIPVWNDGAIDLAPEYLYGNGTFAVTQNR